MKEKDFYFKVTFIYGESVYIRETAKTKKQAVRFICNDFVLVDKVKEIAKSTWYKHKND